MDNPVTLPNSSIRSLARQTLRGKWGEAIMISLLALIISYVPGLILSLLPGAGFLSTFITVYNIIINGPITLSLSYYFLKVFRMEKSSVQDIKYGFSNIMKAVHLYCRMFIFIWLWSLLLIVPGIIASLRYSQAFFIMADDESKTAPECVAESCLLMRGNMLKYVTLLLSFIGWLILAYIPAGIYTYKVIYPVLAEEIRIAVEQGADITQLMGITVNPGPIMNLLTLPAILVEIYQSTAEACFFDILSGGLIIRNAEEDIQDAEETENSAELLKEPEDYNG